MTINSRTSFAVVISLFLVGACAAPTETTKSENAVEDERPIEFIVYPYSKPNPKPRVVVLDFSNDTPFESSLLGPGVANTLVSAMVKSNQFVLIERSRFDRIMKEQSLTVSDLADDKTRVKVGALLGAQYMVTGSVTEFGIKSEGTGLGYESVGSVKETNGTARIVVEARLVDLETSAILAAETGIGTEQSSNIGLAIKKISLVQGVEGFDQTLMGKASRKAVRDLVDKLVKIEFGNGPH